MNLMELAYRRTAILGSSGFGLLIAICDSLASDLRLAAEAERRNDIQTRCLKLRKALAVIAFLEDRADKGAGGELAEQLTGFYRSLQRTILVAQARRSAEMLEEQMNRVLELRQLWYDLELHSSERKQSPIELPQVDLGVANEYATQERATSSWSA